MSEQTSDIERVPAEQMALVRRDHARRSPYPEGYVDNGYGEAPGYGEAEPETSSDPTAVLREVWRACWRRKWLIALVVIVITSLVTLEAFSIRPSYTASTLIEIRKDSAAFIVPGVELDPANTVNLNTKILAFDSRPLLEDVIVSGKFNQNPRFLDAARKRSWLQTIRALIQNPDAKAGPPNVTQPPGNQLSGGAERSAVTGEPRVNGNPQTQADPFKPPPENPQLDPYVSILGGGKKVDPVRDTQAVRISFTHTDPTVAAAVANGLAESFLRRNFRTKIDKYTNAQDWLDRSTAELRERMTKAERDLAEYARNNNIFSVQGQESLTTTKLRRLHDQTLRAEINLMERQALYDEVERGNVEQLPNVFNDGRLRALQARLDEETMRLAQLRMSYGPENPNVAEAEKQVAKWEERKAEVKSSLEERVRNDYERAKREYESLKESLEHAKAEAIQQDRAAVQYSILKQDVDTTKALYNEFLQKKRQAELEVAQQQSNASILKPASVPRSPDGPNRGLMVALGFFLSLGCGVALAFVMERLDRTIKSVADVSRYAQLPTLGVIPAIEPATLKLLAAKNKKNRTKGRLELKPSESSGAAAMSVESTVPVLPKSESRTKKNGSANALSMYDCSAIAEAYRVLRTSVLLSTPGSSPPKTILVTSGGPAEGKTTTLINTGISLAQLGASVLIIDADLRKPSTHKELGVSRAQGLSTYLSQEIEIDQVVQKLRIPNLSLLPCGPAPSNPAELLSSQKMKDLLRSLGERYDHILIDSPPVMYVTDSVILSTLVDGVLLVIHSGRSSRQLVQQARQVLSSVGATVFGVVLNNVNVRHDYYYPDFNYYTYHRDYEFEREEERVSDILS